MSHILIIFTGKSKADIIALGGSGWWKLNGVKARKASHILLVHNAHDQRWPGSEAKHGEAFLIGTLRSVTQDFDGRWLVQIEEFADVVEGFSWPGHRNPITYLPTDEILPNLSLGEWQEMPAVTFEEAQEIRKQEGLTKAPEAGATSSDGLGSALTSFSSTMDRYRKQIADELGVPTDAVKISIQY